jgi:hypothetical protein
MPTSTPSPSRCMAPVRGDSSGGPRDITRKTDAFYSRGLFSCANVIQPTNAFTLSIPCPHGQWTAGTGHRGGVVVIGPESRDGAPKT